MQLLLYFIIGSICGIVNVVAFSILVHSGLGIKIATLTAFAMSAWLNYILCIAILFRHNARWNTFGEVAAYLCSIFLMGLVDYGLTIGFVAAGVAPMFSKIIAACAGFGGDFLLRRFLIFPQPGVVRI
jgi:dolichol-phosphate mannosyltransferase